MEEVLMLLNVVSLSRGYPKLKTIHDDAMAKLEAIADEPKKDDWEKKALTSPTQKPLEPAHRRVAEA